MYFNNRKKETESTNKTSEKAVVSTPSNTIVDVVNHTEGYSKLVEAMKVAEIEGVLIGEGPFTLFAPSNTAFDAAPANVKSYMLNPKKKFQSNSVLSYHLIKEKIMLADLKDGQLLKTAHGGDLKVVFKDGKPTINGANITTADVAASNGVIHMIDALLVPELKK